MQDLVFPAMNRLVSALQDASQATDRISEAFKGAEDEAGGIFRGDLGEGGGAAGGVRGVAGGLSQVLNSPAFQSMLQGMGGGAGQVGPPGRWWAGGGTGGGTGGGFGQIADQILRGTGGAGSNFGNIADSVVNGLKGGNFDSFGSMADNIVNSLRGSASGGSFGDIADSIVGQLRGSQGTGSGPFNQLADEIIRSMGGGSRRRHGRRSRR